MGIWGSGKSCKGECLGVRGVRVSVLVKSVLVAVTLLINGGVGLKFADVSQMSLPL